MNTTIAALTTASLVAGWAASAVAQIGPYGQLQLRARTGTTAYGLPFLASIDDIARPAINDAGALAFAHSQGIWADGASIAAQVAYHQSVSLSNTGVVAWYQSVSNARGIYTHDLASHTTTLVTNEPGSGYDKHSPVINSAGVISYYASTDGLPPGIAQYIPAAGQAQMIVPPSGSGSDFRVGQNRLLDMNESGQVVAMSEQLTGGGIRRYEPNGSSVLMTPGFGHPAFTDRATINNAGDVAVMTGVLLGRSIVRTDGTALTFIVSTMPTTGPVVDLAPVTPVINDLGWVAFSGRGSDLADGVYVGDGVSLVRIAAAGDTLMTDAGLARIARLSSYGIDMNNQGDVAFFADLVSVSTGFSLGTGVIVASVPGCGTGAAVAAGVIMVARRRRRWNPVPAICPAGAPSAPPGA